MEIKLYLYIIKPVDCPTDCILALIIVANLDNCEEIRLCIGKRQANEAIMLTRHHIPTIAELLSDMNAATDFFLNQI